jgi:hypothetical protein
LTGKALLASASLVAACVTVVVATDAARVVRGTPGGAGPLRHGGFVRPVRAAEPLPADAIPVDADGSRGAILFASAQHGLVELLSDGAIRRHRAAPPAPGDAYLDGVYAEGSIFAAVQGRGVVRFGGARMEIVDPAQGVAAARLLPLGASGLLAWTPATPVSPARLRRMSADRTFESIDGVELGTVGDWIEMPERNSVWAATRSGVVEIARDGTRTTLYAESVTAIARNRQHLGVVGTGLARWNGASFEPVLFAIRDPRRPGQQHMPGAPVDLAIDNEGRWFILARGGAIAVLDPDGAFLALLDARDGIPASAARLLVEPATGDIIVGSRREGPHRIHLSPKIQAGGG